MDRVKAFRDLVVNEKTPSFDEFQVLEMLRNGLKDAADLLHNLT